MLWPARLIGAATAAYSTAVLVKPAVLAKPAALTGAGGAVPDDVAVLTRATAARDLLTGLAMALAPRAKGVRLAGMLRLGADLSDAAGMGAALPTAPARRNAALVAGGWGTLTAVALWLARDDD